MERLRIVNNEELDMWVCTECAANLEASGTEFDIVDRDNDEYGDGCSECDINRDSESDGFQGN